MVFLVDMYCSSYPRQHLHCGRKEERDGETHERKLLLNSKLERRLSKVSDTLLSVVHGQTDTRTLEVEHLKVGRLDGLVVRGVDEFKLASGGNDDVGRAVLVSEGVATDDDGLGPSYG
jgi:hypothetical protein